MFLTDTHKAVSPQVGALSWVQYLPTADTCAVAGRQSGQEVGGKWGDRLICPLFSVDSLPFGEV